MLGILLGVDDGLLELIPGSEPNRAITGAAITSLDYRDGVALAGSRAGGVWVHRGRRWEQPEYEPLAEASVHVVRVAPDGRLWAGTEPAGAFVSDDAGKTWRDIEGVRNIVKHQPMRPPTGRKVSVTALAFPKDGAIVGILGGGSWHTRDAGASWLRRSDGLDVALHAMVEHPEQPDRLFASTASGFYRSEDAGYTWVQSLGGLDRSWGGPIAVMPGAPDTLLFAVARRPRNDGSGAEDAALFRSPNGGVTWNRLMLSEEDEWEDLPALARLWNAEDTAFVAAGDKVWASHDYGRNWVELASGLPPVRALVPAL